MSYYINNVDCELGKDLLFRLMPQDSEATKDEAPVIFGTYLDMSRYPDKIHPFMRKILKRRKPNRFRDYLKKYVDTLIMDLYHGDIKKDMEFIVESLKKLTKDDLEEKPKTLVVISSVMTWANSEVIKIQKVEEKEEGEGDDEEGGDDD
jgi:isocitrate dehydrogenase kinase/phosphatase